MQEMVYVFTSLSSVEAVVEEMPEILITQREKQEKEWQHIEDLILSYQLQFLPASTYEQKIASKKSAEELLDKFMPLFKKYLQLVRTGQIDWRDSESKSFVSSFLDEKMLIRAANRVNVSSEDKNQIYRKFNFVRETYGTQSAEEILLELKMLFLVCGKRYKQVGKNFCGYIHNIYKFEVSRHIKKFIRNPLSISYKIIPYEDYINNNEDKLIENGDFDDNIYEDCQGIPDLSWISGMSCSNTFECLDKLSRKILIKYYLEMWNDRQIAEEFGIHINTINQKRREAVNLIAATLGIDVNDLKRNRRSGKKAILPQDNFLG